MEWSSLKLIKWKKIIIEHVFLLDCSQDILTLSVRNSYQVFSLWKCCVICLDRCPKEKLLGAISSVTQANQDAKEKIFLAIPNHCEGYLQFRSFFPSPTQWQLIQLQVMHFTVASIRSDCREAESVEEYRSWLALNFNLTLHCRKWVKTIHSNYSV